MWTNNQRKQKAELKTPDEKSRSDGTPSSEIMKRDDESRAESTSKASKAQLTGTGKAKSKLGGSLKGYSNNFFAK
jgi:hypothetical protein